MPGVALTQEEVASPLARRPMTCESPQVAEWAGHSVGVLHQIYAKCIVGQEEAARKRIAAALGGDSEPAA